jgi:hypothetical protein
VNDAAWSRWWDGRGRERLNLLLWALWDPLDATRVDEYDFYAELVVKGLRATSEAESPLAERADRADSDVERDRSEVSGTSIDDVATLLSDLRTMYMDVPLTRDRERRAAEKLLQWYGREMAHAEV